MSMKMPGSPLLQRERVRARERRRLAARRADDRDVRCLEDRVDRRPERREGPDDGGHALVDGLPSALLGLVRVVVRVADVDLELVGRAAGVLQATRLVDRLGPGLHCTGHLGVRRPRDCDLELADRHDRDRITLLRRPLTSAGIDAQRCAECEDTAHGGHDRDDGACSPWDPPRDTAFAPARAERPARHSTIFVRSVKKKGSKTLDIPCRDPLQTVLRMPVSLSSPRSAHRSSGPARSCDTPQLLC